MAGRSPASIIVLYNYKGGVGKTTIAINLGAQLAEQGSKTLIVDCDPQCNLTGFFHRQPDQEMLPGASALPEEIEENTCILDEGLSEDDTVMPGFKQIPSLPLIESDSLRLEEARRYDFVAIRRNKYTPNIRWCLEKAFKREDCIPEARDLKLSKAMHPNLFVLAGDTLLGDLDEMLIEGENSYKRAKAEMMPRLGSVRYLLTKMAEKHNFEYVLVDLGPSSSLLNKAIVLSSDYILPPVFPDYFSINSVHGFLTRLMNKWIHWKTEIRLAEDKFFREMEDYKDEYDLASYEAYRLKRELPKILPFLVTNYRTRKPPGVHAELVKGELLEKAYAEMANTLTSVVMGNEVKPRVRELYQPNANGKMVVLFCKNLHTALNASQITGVPCVELTGAKIGQALKQKGGSSQMDQVKYAQDRYRSLAQFIIGLHTTTGKAHGSRA